MELMKYNTRQGSVNTVTLCKGRRSICVYANIMHFMIFQVIFVDRNLITLLIQLLCHPYEILTYLLVKMISLHLVISMNQLFYTILKFVLWSLSLSTPIVVSKVKCRV